MLISQAKRQMPAEAGRDREASGEAVRGPIRDEARGTPHGPEDIGPGLLEAMLARENLQVAWKRVKANKGAAGTDGLDIEQTRLQLQTV